MFKGFDSEHFNGGIQQLKMIKQTEPDVKVLKQEFEKGNIYNIARYNKKEGDNSFAIIKGFDDDFVIYDVYSCENFRRVYDNATSDTKEWSWDDSDFIILTPEEARPYLQKIMLATLENSGDKNDEFD